MKGGDVKLLYTCNLQVWLTWTQTIDLKKLQVQF